MLINILLEVNNNSIVIREETKFINRYYYSSLINKWNSSRRGLKIFSPIYSEVRVCPLANRCWKSSVSGWRRHHTNSPMYITPGHKCMLINADFAVNLSRRPIHETETVEHIRGIGRCRCIHTYIRTYIHILAAGWLLRLSLKVCVLACKYLIKAALVAGGICARARCVRASTTRSKEWLDAARGSGHTVATVNIWLCMSFAGAECTLTATVLARRRINPATCSRERWIMTFYRNDICTALIRQKPPSRLGDRRGAIRFGPRMVTMLGVVIGSGYSLGQNAIPLDIFCSIPKFMFTLTKSGKI